MKKPEETNIVNTSFLLENSTVMSVLVGTESKAVGVVFSVACAKRIPLLNYGSLLTAAYCLYAIGRRKQARMKSYQ